MEIDEVYGISLCDENEEKINKTFELVFGPINPY